MLYKVLGAILAKDWFCVNPMISQVGTHVCIGKGLQVSAKWFSWKIRGLPDIRAGASDGHQQSHCCRNDVTTQFQWNPCCNSRVLTRELGKICPWCYNRYDLLFKLWAIAALALTPALLFSSNPCSPTKSLCPESLLTCLPVPNVS